MFLLIKQVAMSPSYGRSQAAETESSRGGIDGAHICPMKRQLANG